MWNAAFVIIKLLTPTSKAPQYIGLLRVLQFDFFPISQSAMNRKYFWRGRKLKFHPLNSKEKLISSKIFKIFSNKQSPWYNSLAAFSRRKIKKNAELYGAKSNYYAIIKVRLKNQSALFMNSIIVLWS